MKRRRLYTAAWIVLTTALLFNQVGLNFFHDSHEAHEFYAATQQNKSLLLNHGDHCRVCSLEILFNVILPVTTELPQQDFVTAYYQKVYTPPIFTLSDFTQGRAPPAQA